MILLRCEVLFFLLLVTVPPSSEVVVGHKVDSQRDISSYTSKRDINDYQSGCSINNLRAREGGLYNVSLQRDDMEKEVSQPISFPQDVLCDLATSIPGLLSYTNSSWNCTAAISDGAYCFWRGVTCDSGNAITGISILSTFEGTANFSTIPSSISSLSSLQILSIKYCGLQGTIPFSLSALSYLRSLVLSSNVLQGTIPDSLSALTNLQTLYINNNSFIGTLPASVMSMSSLLYLDVSLNKFVGKFPDFYGMNQNSFKKITPYLTLKSNQRSSPSLPIIERETIMVIEMERDKSIVEIVEQMKPANMKNERNERKITENENENEDQNQKKFLHPEKIIEDYNENGRKKGESSETPLFNEEHSSDEMNFEEDRYLKSVQTYYSPDYDVPISTSSTPYTSSVGLRFLSLYANFLTGTIPSSISLMTSLIGFHVSYNSFTGTIPPSLGNILSLKYLSLQWNSLNGTIPHTIGRLSNLNYLKLFTNSLTGTLPHTFGNLISLKSMILKYNQLRGKIPSSFGKLKSLEEIDLGYNSLTGAIPSSFGSLNISLKNLYLKENKLTGTIPPSLGNLYGLTRMGLNANRLQGSIPHSFSNLIKITNLYLSVNSLTGSIPSSIGLLTNLVQLSLRSNLLTSTLPNSLSKLRNLQVLQLYENLFTGILPVEMSELSKLESFYIHSNKLFGTVPYSYGKLTSLKSFNLASNLLTGTIPSSYSNLKLLTSVDIRKNKFTGKIKHILLNFESTISLDASENYFSGILEIGTYFGIHLNYLNLAYNNITGNLPSNLSSLPSLSRLNLSGNGISGIIPNSGATYTSLITLDLSYNNLSGELGNALCHLKSLTAIHVEGNDFSCYATCLPLANKSLSVNTGQSKRGINKIVPHCKGKQDEVICTMARRMDVSKAVKRSGTYTPITVQNTMHPYISLTTEYVTVSVPEAIEYTITFDTLTKTELFQDTVTFCSDTSCTVIYGQKAGYSGLTGTSWPGVDGTNQLVISASSFVVRFTTNGGNQYWGYRLVALARSAPGVGWVCDSSGYATGLCDTMTWAGVTCVGRQVRGLVLSNLGISGSLPDNLEALYNLRRLDLHFNFIAGTIPTSIGKLTQLEYLDLSGNKFSGSIPSSLGNLGSLWKLSLSSNALTGSIPTTLANLQLVKFFLMSANRLSGVLPQELCKIAHSNIDISSNSLMTCYESTCWSEHASELQTYYDFGTLQYCAPSHVPTSSPSQPTSRPSDRLARAYVIQTDSKTITLSATIAASVISCVSFLVCTLFGFILYFKWREDTENRKIRNKRLKRLINLPVHRAIIDKMETSDLLTRLNDEIYDYTSAKEKDIDGRTAFDLALKNDADCRVVAALLLNSLPFNSMSGEPVPADEHGYAWAKVVEQDKYEPAVSLVLSRHPTIVLQLSKFNDEGGRQVVDIASPRCKKTIQQMIYIFRRYEITSPIKYPVHNSSTSIVHLAIDHQDNKRSVALKFIKHRDHFMREIRARSSGHFNDEFVVSLIRFHDGDEDEIFSAEMEKKGFGNFNYCLVLEAADVTLGEIIANEHVGNKDWEFIRLQAIQVARSLEHLHSKGFIHGDIKPRNIMRIGQKLKLIDLDACVCYTNREEYSGVKYSSAYVPPELLYATHDTVVILCPFAETRIRKQSLSSAGAAGSTGRRNSIQYGITKDTVLYNGITANERSHLQGSWTDSGIVESKHTSNNGDNSSGSGDSYRDRSRSAYRINDNDVNEPVYHRRDRVFSIDSSSYVRRNSMTRSDDSVGTSAQCMSVGTCTQSLSTVAQQLDEVPSPLYFDNDQNGLSLSPGSRRNYRRFSESKHYTMTMNDVPNSEQEQHIREHKHEHGKEGGGGGGGGGEDELKLDFILAAPSHDMWSFGALLFYMAVNAPLIHSDIEGTALSDSELRVIAVWSDEVKLSKMLCINNLPLRNLISQLLDKCPNKRPDIKRVLAHPYLTGKTATRLAGQDAEFDVFLSYRVDADCELVDALYRMLLAEGVTVWLDRTCLLPGEPWEEGFCRGMAMSRIFVPVLSREAIKSTTRPRSNFEILNEDSSCDNVLLEHRLALELKERGLIEKIFPIFVGDIDESRDGFLQKFDFMGEESCHPKCPELVVLSNEMRVIEHLEKQGLGLPFIDEMTVKDVLSGITRYQGAFIDGEVSNCLNSVVMSIITMISNEC